MITYNDIYEAARKERYSDQLQPLMKNFVSEVATYLKEKKDLTLTGQDEFVDSNLKTKKQIENAITLFKELLLRRRKKILNLVLIASETGISKQDFENMLDFEKELFETLMKCFESSDKKVNEILNGKNGESIKNELICFKENVDEFMGFDGEKVGPFDTGQIANLPREITRILIDSGKAELIED